MWSEGGGLLLVHVGLLRYNVHVKEAFKALGWREYIQQPDYLEQKKTTRRGIA